MTSNFRNQLIGRSSRKRLLYIIISLNAFAFCQAGSATSVKTNNYIEGNIQDEVGEPLQYGAIVKVKGTKIQDISDTKGHYKLLLPDSLLNRCIDIAYTCVGFKNFEINVNSENLPVLINVELEPEYVEEHILTNPITVKYWKESRQVK